MESSPTIIGSGHNRLVESYPLNGGRHLLKDEGLNDIADLEGGVAFERDPALKAVLYLADVVLKPSK